METNESADTAAATQPDVSEEPATLGGTVDASETAWDSCTNGTCSACLPNHHHHHHLLLDATPPHRNQTA
ncbi:unnamed protein product [Lampetra planeri]